MFVVFVCASEKKAIARSAAVLDAYALRIGERTWQSPMTVEGLTEVRVALRRTATKNTAVACWRNDGRTKLRLMWTVGRSATFTRSGAYPLATQRRKQTAPLPAFVRAAAIIAQAAGLAHDLGKYAVAFQKKLSADKATADAIRHEWISAEFVSVALAEPETLSFTALWQIATDRAIRRVSTDRTDAVFHLPPRDASGALIFAVLTHHRLPYEGTKDKPHQVTGAPVAATYFDPRNDREGHRNAADEPPSELFQRFRKALQRCRGLTSDCGDTLLFWRAVATYARQALILADHSVSSRTHSNTLISTNNRLGSAHANTKRIDGKRYWNQPLSAHLNDVGNLAGEMVTRLWNYRPAAVSPATRERIDKPTKELRFVWQNTAAAALQHSAESDAPPTLVLNLAATGSGKTRGNVRMLSALRQGQDLRVATALNLRSLTLQVGAVYRRELMLEPDEIDCVIGDRRITEMANAKPGSAVRREAEEEPLDDDDNIPEPDFEATNDGDPPPPWLEPFFERRAALRAVISTPMLVSTVDFLVAAGEPNLQGHHALAMLRLMKSDVVLDEIDGYDPKALAAVSRLVLYAAFWGRHVVASSATLSKVVAKRLLEMFDFGSRMRAAAFNAEPAWCVALVSDSCPPTLVSNLAPVAFDEAFDGFVTSAHAPLAYARFRPVCLWPIVGPTAVPKPSGGPGKPRFDSSASKPSEPSEASYFSQVASAALKLHESHRWELRQGVSVAKISLGLIRVANIATCIDLCHHLAQQQADRVRVVAYHSQLTMLQRWNLEKTLDCLLTRKSSGYHDTIAASAYIREALGWDDPSAQSEDVDVALIVVATPVEEVGRDHDFDWAVIEPSSAQSIVQTAGRVNRHRLVPVEKPNVAVLQFNLRAWRGCERLAFVKPGLEKDESHAREHNLAKLLDWQRLHHVDARLRFDTASHALARFDESALDDQTKTWFSRVQNDTLWISETTYRLSPLRDADQPHSKWHITLDEKYELLVRSERGIEWLDRNTSVTRIPRPNSGVWLTPTFNDLLQIATDHGLDADRYLEVQLLTGADQTIVHDLAFGFRSAK